MLLPEQPSKTGKDWGEGSGERGSGRTGAVYGLSVAVGRDPALLLYPRPLVYRQHKLQTWGGLETQGYC